MRVNSNIKITHRLPFDIVVIEDSHNFSISIAGAKLQLFPQNKIQQFFPAAIFANVYERIALVATLHPVVSICIHYTVLTQAGVKMKNLYLITQCDLLALVFVINHS